MNETLQRLSKCGFAPTVVIDAGANVGQWSRVAGRMFANASFHLIEPQPACAVALSAFCVERPSTEFHQIAVTRPGRKQVRMTDADGSTGAYVRDTGEAPTDRCLPATTFDELFATRVNATSRVLLKLDLEGHELDALAGAEWLLTRTELLITEVQFYQIDRNGQPTFADVVVALRDRGFHPYDIAALASRPRDGRLRLGDVVFARHGSSLLNDERWA
jgi:FkbM family methyltransferase